MAKPRPQRDPTPTPPRQAPPSPTPPRPAPAPAPPQSCTAPNITLLQTPSCSATILSRIFTWTVHTHPFPFSPAKFSSKRKEGGFHACKCRGSRLGARGSQRQHVASTARGVVARTAKYSNLGPAESPQPQRESRLPHTLVPLSTFCL